jgi:hypothetical protein
MLQLHSATDVCEGLCEHDQIVCMAKAEMLVDEDARQIAETFKILGDPTRIICGVTSAPSTAGGATGQIPQRGQNGLVFSR